MRQKLKDPSHLKHSAYQFSLIHLVVSLTELNIHSQSNMMFSPQLCLANPCCAPSSPLDLRPPHRPYHTHPHRTHEEKFLRRHAPAISVSQKGDRFGLFNMARTVRARQRQRSSVEGETDGESAQVRLFELDMVGASRAQCERHFQNKFGALECGVISARICSAVLSCLRCLFHPSIERVLVRIGRSRGAVGFQVERKHRKCDRRC